MTKTQYSTLVAAGLLALAGRAAPAAAQDVAPEKETPFASIGSYVIAMPVGDTHQFVPTPAWLGFSWEVQWQLRRDALGGIVFGFHDFYDQTLGTTDFPAGAATGLQRRGLAIVSLLGTTRWFPLGRAWRGVFLGFGLGGNYTQQYYQLGVTSQVNRSSFHLIAAPELGTSVPVFDGLDLVVSARYNATTRGGDYLGGGGRRYSYLSLGVGLAER